MSQISRRRLVVGAMAAAANVGQAAIPLEIAGLRCILAVRLNDAVARMVLDTGAERTVLSRAAMLRLGLPADRWVATTLRGATGRLERYANANVRRASAGCVPLFQRAGRPGLNLPVTSANLGGVDGLLGADVLCHHDLVLTMAQQRLLLLQNLPMPAEFIRLQSYRQNLLLAPVLLDGHALTALVDTGAAASLVNARGLFKLGMARPAPADRAVQLRAIGGASETRAHRFGLLQVGAWRIHQPMLLTDAMPEAAYDMILGLDILGQRTVLLSYAGMGLGFG